MNYRYRVTLAGIKGFYRVYLVNGDNSLYTFHKQLRSDLEFPMDQPILFKAMDAEGAVVARYALMDIGFGAVDNVTVADTVKAGVTSFRSAGACPASRAAARETTMTKTMTTKISRTTRTRRMRTRRTKNSSTTKKKNKKNLQV